MRSCKWCGTAIVYLETRSKKKMCVAINDMALVNCDAKGKLTIEAVAHQSTCEPFRRQKKIDKIDRPP